MITLTTELSRIRGLTPNFLKKLEKLEIKTVRDLLFHFPSRYDDFSRIIPIAHLAPATSGTVRGVIRTIALKRSWKRRMPIVEATITDDSGGIRAIWFNQPFIAKILKEGTEANFAGKVSHGNDGLYLASPSYEPIRTEGESRHTGGLIPIYPETRGLTSRGIRYIVKPLLNVLPNEPDFIPSHILEAQQLPSWSDAIRSIHFPRTLGEADQARRRFAFENLYLLQLLNLKTRNDLTKLNAPVIQISEADRNHLLSLLPFTLTSPQEETLTEILHDLGKGIPMNRLLQGDVGSGKTVVAALAALAAAKERIQTAFMAPTEVLATQHYETLHKLFAPVFDMWGIRVSLITGSTPHKTKKATAYDIKTGVTQIVLGTHALIEKDIVFKNLALVVIDEQHRFGVSQRAHLAKSKDQTGNTKTVLHLLSMSATPIPRTLSLTLFGDLDLSIINQLPQGRKPIVTKIVAPENRMKAYDFIRTKVKEGRQVFVICPRIEATEEKTEPRLAKNASRALWSESKTVTTEFEKLSKNIFPEFRVAMLHGKMKAKEKETIMAEFKKGMIDILIATSVIEVGVDVPNAALMVIEGSEHFGLAQLYQFRGRIGRGEHQSYCLLFTESESKTVSDRLQALTTAKNGFELAELDLAIRGPGEFLGNKQTGLPDLAMRSLSDLELIKSARDAASLTIGTNADFSKYPLLIDRLTQFKKTIHIE